MEWKPFQHKIAVLNQNIFSKVKMLLICCTKNFPQGHGKKETGRVADTTTQLFKSENLFGKSKNENEII